MAEIRHMGTLVVGPRELPERGQVRVWMDSGSGGGHEITVRAEHLALAEIDRGEGASAIYRLHTHSQS